MMPESLAWTAFLLGLVSACSLPLGALTTRLWTPDDRAMAVLMAFGGGALLAALTIDLVGSALASGELNALAFGAVLGGILFVALNQIVNDFGGFLRKTSTTVYHLRRKEHRRIRRIIGQIAQADLLRDLSRQDYKALGPSVRSLEVPKGTAIYQAGDPADAIYIVAAGEVKLSLPGDQSLVVESVGRNETFGWLSCITGTPTADSAIAVSDAALWVIPKAALDGLILNSPELGQRVHRLLRSDNVPQYLETRLGMPAEAAQAWLDRAVQSLIGTGRVPPAMPVRRNEDAFRARVGQLRRFPLIQGLPPEDLERVLDRLIYKVHRRGENLFHQDEPASRMFFIERGRASLIDPLGQYHRVEHLKEGDACGGSSLLTGARHTMTAVTTEETAVWELRRNDLDELLRTAPSLASRVRAWIEDGEALVYLMRRQHLSADKAERWSRAAVRALVARQPLPTAAAMTRGHQESAGAPLAIFLGITLDGIPESLVIGASAIHSSVSLSLILGLFLSNYPEALSSSVGMRQQGMSLVKVVSMWSALMLITGLGAAAGSQFFIDADPRAFAVIEGLAAGAMLTMIAETMLPEAYFKGGQVVGLSTLAGFLVAIYSKTLEPVDETGHGMQAPTPAAILEYAPHSAADEEGRVGPR